MQLFFSVTPDFSRGTNRPNELSGFSPTRKQFGLKPELLYFAFFPAKAGGYSNTFYIYQS